jgi:hypothetical protein
VPLWLLILLVVVVYQFVPTRRGRLAALAALGVSISFIGG